jgi:hypothetical protein
MVFFYSYILSEKLLLFFHCPRCVPGYIFFVQLFVFSIAIANFDMYLFLLLWGNPEHNKLIIIIKTGNHQSNAELKLCTGNIAKS